MVNERTAPELRFNGFSELWEQHGLTDVLSPTVGNNTLSRADLSYDGGDVNNQTVEGILTRLGWGRHYWCFDWEDDVLKKPRLKLISI